MKNCIHVSVIFLNVLALGGCSILNRSADIKKAQETLAYETSGCSKDYPIRIGNYYNNALCMDTAEFKYANIDKDEYPLTAARSRIRDEVAQAIDERKISPQRGQAIFNRFYLSEKARIEAEQSKRKGDLILKQQEINSRIFNNNNKFYQMPIPEMKTPKLSTPTNCTYNSFGNQLYQRCY